MQVHLREGDGLRVRDGGHGGGGRSASRAGQVRSGVR